ncbi:hypothetical protein ACFVXG_30800 [Kitasatospora sp. NPDC058162]|uniref:hypothetical protein n=1 Tax=Kitasatospora sp. NPDC058162 TaxID=3346362 RepID=UPI0036D90F90
MHVEAWEAGATLHAALARHPNRPARTRFTQDEDDGQEDGLRGDVPHRVRRRAAGMTLENLQQALEQARVEERHADRYADAGDETAYATAATVCAEWQRVRPHRRTRAERYDPDRDTALQHALRAQRHRQDVAECAREAAHRARQTTAAALRRLAGTAAQPPLHRPRPRGPVRAHRRRPPGRPRPHPPPRPRHAAPGRELAGAHPHRHLRAARHRAGPPTRPRTRRGRF